VIGKAGRLAMTTEISWLSSIGPAVGNHLWQSTAFAAVVWGVTLLLRRNQARVRYGLWLAASLKFLLPFSLLVGLGGLLPRPQRALAAEPVTYTVDAMAQPFTEAPIDVAPVAVEPIRMQRLEYLLSLALGIVWLCGAGTVLLAWGTRCRQVRVTLRRAVRMEDGREAELLRRVEASIGGCGHIPLLLSRELMEPGIFWDRAADADLAGALVRAAGR
jgi:bla regulator protein blaR1